MVRICGHRGAAGLAPENTLASFARALDLGVELVECDVHCTADGRVVVIHDETLNRTTNGTGRVDGLTYDAIRAYDAGGGERVPELREVAELVKGRAELVCEFKADASVAPAVACLRDSGLLADTTFISFEWEHLAYLKEIAPAARFAALLWECDDQLLASALAVGGDIDIDFSRVSLRVVEEVKKAGRFLWVYTPNTWNHFKLMIDMGVDVLTTDRPDIALEELKAAHSRDAIG